MKIKAFKSRLLMLAILVLGGCGLAGGYYHLMGGGAYAGSASVSFSDAQAILKEVMSAYADKTTLIQYESVSRRNQYLSPEQITKYNTAHMSCTAFAFAVFHEAFGMKIPATSKDLSTYAGAYATIPVPGDEFGGKKGGDEFSDIVYRIDSVSNTSEDGIKSLLIYLLRKNLIKDGDIISWAKGDSGHDVVVYNVVYNAADETNSKIEVYQAGATDTGAYDVERRIQADTKVGISYYDSSGLDPVTDNNHGGTLYLTDLLSVMKRRSAEVGSFTVYRPHAYINDGKYNAVEITLNVDKYVVEGVHEEPILSGNVKAGQMRNKYDGIRIEKKVTSDKGAVQGSIAELGDELTYAVLIKNTSNHTYSGLKIVEEVSPSSVIGSQQHFERAVPNIPGGGQYEFTYTVSVPSLASLIGTDIVAEGYVEDASNSDGMRIKTTTIKNRIGTNLTEAQRQSVMAKYNFLKNSHKGVALIDKIYKEAFDYELGLSELVLGGLDSGAGSGAGHEQCNLYTTYERAPLIKNERTYLFNEEGGSPISLNPESRAYDLVLPGYYNGLSSYGRASCANTRIPIYQNYRETKKEIYETDRKDTINSDTLMAGDILLYANKPFTDSQPRSNLIVKEGDVDVNKGPYQINENGVYAFIYDGNNFVGNNSDKGSNARNIVYGTNDCASFSRNKGDYTQNDLQHMFGKDYYVILRPALVMNIPVATYTISYNANDGSGNMDDQTIEEGKTVNLSANIFAPPSGGYAFAGWNTKANGTGDSYSDRASVTLGENITLYAQWKYVITFGDNGGTGSMTDQVVLRNKIVNLKANTFVGPNGGRPFIGWNTKADGTGISYTDGQAVRNLGNITLYAIYAEIDSYVLSFDYNNGSGAINNLSCKPAVVNGACKIVIPSVAPTRERHLFVGYADSTSATTVKYAAGDTINLSGDKTIYAVWLSGSIVWVQEQTHIIGDENDLVFRISYPSAQFVELIIDDERVSGTNYVVKDGSTIITIDHNYVDSNYAEGSHSVVAVYSNNVRIGTSFTLVERGSDSDPDPEPGPELTPDPDPDPNPEPEPIPTPDPNSEPEPKPNPEPEPEPEVKLNKEREEDVSDSDEDENMDAPNTGFGGESGTRNMVSNGGLMLPLILVVFGFVLKFCKPNKHRKKFD